MIRLQHLVRTPQVSVLRLDHEPDIDHSDPEQEVCSNYAINFVEAGSFELGTQKKSWILSPGYVFVSQPGTVHHYTHYDRMPSDICVSVVYAGSFINDRHGDHLCQLTFQ